MPAPSISKTAILLIDCPDPKGIVATIVNFLVNTRDINIPNADQRIESATRRAQLQPPRPA